MSRSVSITVAVDLAGIEKRFSQEKLDSYQAAFANRVGFDSNYFCKVDTGRTRDSMALASDFKNGDVTWDTPYAIYAYTQPNALLGKNPNATDHWFETAKSVRLNDWVRLCGELLSNG